MKICLRLLVILLVLLSPLSAAAFTSGTEHVARVADSISRSIDRQLSEMLEAEGFSPSSLRIALTVPVNLSNFEKSNALARQMSEDISRYLVQAGYRVVELRKGSDVEMIPREGEFLLSRDTKRLERNTLNTELILTGTYTMTTEGVRFNIRLLHTATTDVVAMASGTVTIKDDLYPLLVENALGNRALTPSVKVNLN